MSANAAELPHGEVPDPPLAAVVPLRAGGFDEQLGDAIDAETAEIAGILNAANARLVELTERAIAARLPEMWEMRSPAHWLMLRAGLSPTHAHQIVRLAERRASFPVSMAAFAEGRLSADQMAEVVKAPAWADAKLVDFAVIATVTQLRRSMRRECFDRPTEQPAPPPPANRVSFGVTADHRWRFSGELNLDLGRRVEAALTESKDRLFEGGETDVTWADALVDVAERSLSSLDSGDRRDRFRTWIHVDVTDGAATLTDGWRLPESLRRLLLCDGAVQPVWEQRGLPVSVGHTTRVIPPRTRRAVEHRDRGCRVPGCTVDRSIEVHHIEHWEDGGPTDTANLLSLCRKHHRMHHQGSIGITGNADEPDGVRFTTPRGSPIEAGRPRPPTDGLPKPAKRSEPPIYGRFDYRWIGNNWTISQR